MQPKTRKKQTKSQPQNKLNKLVQYKHMKKGYICEGTIQKKNCLPVLLSTTTK